MSFVATLSIGKDSGGLPVDEFCALQKIVEMKHGKNVLISTQDEQGRMHLTNPEVGEVTGYLYRHHLGYIDIRTGSLVWDGAA